MSRPLFNHASRNRLARTPQAAAVFLAVLSVLAPVAATAAPKAAVKHAPAKTQAALRVIDSCNWDKPGADALVNMIPPTVDNFTDIPAETRKRLIKRMDRRAFDDFVLIRRDSISSGKHRYDAQISNMQFGNGTLCKSVKRTNWSVTQVTRALIYCESGTCVLVPTELRNVALVKRLPPTRVAEAEPTEEPDLLASLPPTAAGPGAGVGGVEGGAPTQAFSSAAPASFEQVALAEPSFAGAVANALGAPIFGLGSSGGGNTDPGGANGDGGNDNGGSNNGNGSNNGSGGSVQPPVSVVPEPGVMALWAAGLATLVGVRRRRRA